MKIAFIFLLVPVFCWAQTPVTPEERQKANSYYVSADWKNAAENYKRIADREPQNWNARLRLGVSLISLGRANEGIKPLEEAVKISNNNQSMYYLAGAFAATSQSDQAFHWLEESVKLGFAQLTVFDADKSLALLKSDPRYEKNREGILRAVYPCRYSEKAREFDFWIGEWDVRNVQGQPAGKSKIEVILGDCVVLENWTSALPNVYSGKSFNLYDAVTLKWMQTWVDDKGAVLEFLGGEYKDNKMVFNTRPDSKNQITRLTFHNLGPDLVRQQFETTTDNGKTWTTTIDLQYNRVK